MAKRISLSKKLRFEVFKRDSFSCQYCGSTPPKVILEVDHIIPVSKKGTNDFDNLITSCFDCNRGKSDNELTSLPSSTTEKLEIIKEKELQYKQYQKALKSIENRINREIESVSEVYTKFNPEWVLSEGFKLGTIKKFISQLGVNSVIDSMQIACCRGLSPQETTRYFCGVHYTKLKN